MRSFYQFSFRFGISRKCNARQSSFQAFLRSLLLLHRILANYFFCDCLLNMMVGMRWWPNFYDDCRTTTANVTGVADLVIAFRRIQRGCFLYVPCERPRCSSSIESREERLTKRIDKIERTKVSAFVRGYCLSGDWSTCKFIISVQQLCKDPTD